MKIGIKNKLFILILLLTAIFVLFNIFYTLPNIKQDLMNEKKIQTKNLIDISISLLENYHQRSLSGELSVEAAQSLALQSIGNLRYGEQRLDYYWINDHHPVMLVHPFRPDLEGQDVSELYDAQGLALVKEFVRVVEQDGSGYVPYHWQYYEDTERIEPKISYVAGFQPWGWIVGTGVYVNDVELIYANRRNVMLLVSAIVTAIAVMFAVLIAREIARPIVQLKDKIEAATTGDMSVRVSVRGTDEIAQAAEGFNQMMSRLKQLTYYDSVTNLANQQSLFNDFEKIAHDTEYDKQIMILLISADKFKEVNEEHGYKVGDGILKEAAERLIKLQCIKCKLYRGNSDEIIAVVKNVEDLEQTVNLAEKYLQNVNKKYTVFNKTVQVSFSGGIAFYPTHGSSIHELLKNAGFARSMAKMRAYDHSKFCTMFDYNMHLQAIEIRHLKDEMVLALENKDFYLEYQPIFCVKSKKIAAVEALLRWQHVERGMIPPDVFIPIAENSGLIRALGKYVLKEACKQHVAWSASGLVVDTMSVNISAEQFMEVDFIEELKNILQRTNMKPEHLELELTESTTIQELDENIKKMHKIREMNIRIAIDDFGTGYSSLSYIVKIPANKLKIDRSFVMSWDKSTQAKMLVETIIALGQSLNLEVVAEGIETQEQLDLVARNGCDYAQGYFLSKPVAAGVVEYLLEKEKP